MAGYHWNGVHRGTPDAFDEPPKPRRKNRNPCGTIVAYRRHGMRGEDACEPCKAAHEKHLAERAADRKRQQKQLKPCGTRAAYRRHEFRGEKPCGPCERAEREYNAERYLIKRKGIAA